MGYLTRFLVFTNRGIYIFNDNDGTKRKSGDCDCHPSELCPDKNEPNLIFSFRYSQLHSIRKFNLAVQKIFLTFNNLDPKQQKQYQEYFSKDCYKDNQ